MSDLKAKMNQHRFRWGSTPDPVGGAYSTPQATYLDLKGPTSKEKGGCREGEGRGWVKGRMEEKGGRERKEERKKEREGRENGRGRKGAGRGSDLFVIKGHWPLTHH